MNERGGGCQGGGQERGEEQGKRGIACHWNPRNVNEAIKCALSTVFRGKLIKNVCSQAAAETETEREIETEEQEGEEERKSGKMAAQTSET